MPRPHFAHVPYAFRRLWAADALSSAGDGFTLIAAPLLVVSLTSNPILIAGAVTAQYLPWLFAGLLSGSLVDRTADPRRLMITIDLGRAGLMAILAATAWTGTVTVPLVYVLLFLSGLGDTVVSTATVSLIPRVVDRPTLTQANARLLSTRLVGGALLARPVGAWLFTRGAGTPFAVDAISFAAGVALLIGLPLRQRERAATSERPKVRDGLRLLWDDAVLRVLALCILVMNITYAGTMAILVLVARDRLGLTETGYGLLLACAAVGGLLGSALVHPLETRFGVAILLKVGLAIEAGLQLTLALTRSPWVAGIGLFVFGVHSSVWTVLTVTLRQRRTTDTTLGRLSAAYQMLSIGGAAIGSAFGGLLVHVGSLTTPMWFGTAVVATAFAVATRTLRAAAIEPPAGATVETMEQPEPDAKDWTFVLHTPCPECGYDGTHVAGRAVATLARDTIPRYQEALGRPAAAARLRPDSWSVLEYGAHARDVCRIFDARLHLMLDEDDPQFANWDQDATALAERYWTQEPATISTEYSQAAEQIATTLDGVASEQWQRPGRRSNGAVFTVDSLARYFAHDLVHHLHDISA